MSVVETVREKETVRCCGDTPVLVRSILENATILNKESAADGVYPKVRLTYPEKK